MALRPFDTVTGLPHWLDQTRTDFGRDFAFDPYLNIRRDRQEALFARLRSVLDAGRSRARRKEDGENARQVLGCVVGNAIIAMRRGPHTRVHYSRGKATYYGRSPYHPGWLSSKLLLQVIDQLGREGYLRLIHADPGPFAGQGVYRSTYRVLPPLDEILSELGITEASVARDEGASPVVFLRDQKRSLQSYDAAAPPVAEMIQLLRDWNGSVAGVELAPGAFSASRPTPAAPEQKALYRLFDGSFEEHGRFYGGWWQNLPKEERRAITIDGEPTIELDYAGMHPRLLYHLEGTDLVGDAYEIFEIREAAERDGLPWSDVRPVVKGVFSFMINSKKRGAYGSSAFAGWPPSLPKAEGVAAIERRHGPIKEHFFKREGLRLMNWDARICEAVLRRGLRDNITVLPVHDSFIVQEKHEDWLRSAMTSAYREIVGFDPVVA